MKHITKGAFKMPMGKDMKAVSLRMKKEQFAVVEKIAKAAGKSLNKILSGMILKTINYKEKSGSLPK
ncbi:MAG TPA: hypothetical protein PK453_27985 [Leptospiraceae bacterium]|nr:hypothetical protein [Leptospiraceae bacterium]